MVRRFPIESCLGKREKLARFAWRSGFTHILERLPKRSDLIVWAYHQVAAPGFVVLYQINVLLPFETYSGPAMPLVIRLGNLQQ